MQEIVDGYIEVYEPDKETVLVFNEEGKLRGLKPCIPVDGDVIVGDVIVCSRNDDGEFCSLSAAQLTIWEKLLSIPNIRDCGMLERDVIGER